MEISNHPLEEANAGELKACCAHAYQSDWMQFLLGDSFHPGGKKLTEYLGRAINLGPGQSVLDVASGRGTSAIWLAQRFGCTVLGVEYGHEAVGNATQAAQAAGVGHLVSFQQGDAECLPVPESTFDAVICECAFCTFPNKAVAASEFSRVLKPGGRVGLSDVTRMGDIPEELQSLLAWIACLADAQSIEDYQRSLTEAGFIVTLAESHNEVLADMVREIRNKLFGAELLAKLGKLDLPRTIDFEQAKVLAKEAAESIQANRFGYAIIAAVR